ncbi:MAG: Riboflavin biosynthesis protein RibF [Phycisphaerae bacterium]|nr:Riboflavin biosynthesis protein RibF [Phycisphaerae bacterium]
MAVFQGMDSVRPDMVAGGALSIGNFDGVHLGHQRIVATARELARPAVVMTFDPHPMAVLNPRQAPPAMTSPQERADLLIQAGADAVVIVATSRELLGMEAEAFVHEVIVARFAPRVVVEGPGFGFGRERRGDTDLLAEMGRRLGFDVRIADKVSVVLGSHRQLAPVSSTLVRRLLSAGSVEDASACLGRPYRLIGQVVGGHGRGRTLGYPTANLDTGAQLQPAEGVYAAIARCGSVRTAAAVSIGPSPTFDQQTVTVEAHLVDFQGPLPEARMELDLLRRLRGIERFASPEALAAQIARDVELTRSVAAQSKSLA